jgi:hypothetical protein
MGKRGGTKRTITEGNPFHTSSSAWGGHQQAERQPQTLRETIGSETKGEEVGPAGPHDLQSSDTGGVARSVADNHCTPQGV